MKSCPKCNRTFPDEGQKFCTYDGGLLVAPQNFDPNVTIRATATDLPGLSPVDSEKETSRDLPDPSATLVASAQAPTIAFPRNTAPTGRPITADFGPVPPAPPAQAPVRPETVTLPSIPPPPVKKKSKLPWIIVGLLVILLLGGGALAAVFFVVVSRDSKTCRSAAQPPRTRPRLLQILIEMRKQKRRRLRNLAGQPRILIPSCPRRTQWRSQAQRTIWMANWPTIFSISHFTIPVRGRRIQKPEFRVLITS